MKMWGLATVSLGGFLIMSSQLQENSAPLIITGISIIVVGCIMFIKGNSSTK